MTEELHTVSKLTKEKILQIIRNEKKKINTMGIKDVICNVIHKIEMYDDKIDILVDLTYLFQVLDGNNRLFVRISEIKTNVSHSENLYELEYSIEKYGKILKEELKKRTST